MEWLQHAPDQHDVFHTDSYARLNPAGQHIRATASGILAIRAGPQPGEYIIWFRPELVQTVTWAGRHEKNQTTADGQIFLSPRQSFEAWKQTVENTRPPGGPWKWRPPRNCACTLPTCGCRLFNELQARRQPGPPQRRAGAQQRRAGFVCLRGLARPEGAAAGHSQLLPVSARRLRRQARCRGREQAADPGAPEPAHGGADRVAAAALARGPPGPGDAADQPATKTWPKCWTCCTRAWSKPSTTVTVADPLPTVHADRRCACARYSATCSPMPCATATSPRST